MTQSILKENPNSITVKKFLKTLLPSWVVASGRSYLQAKEERRYLKRMNEFDNLSQKEVFTKIYEEGWWGKDERNKYCSGGGSHDQHLVTTYIESVQKFLSSFDQKINVVDLGCGDFSVGSKLRHFCNNYIACDIVEPVIEWNKEKYRNYRVDFRLVDITQDDLPEGDVVFIRQVLQHLSNQEIAKVIQQITKKYRFLVLTEHLPILKQPALFIANKDKRAGPDIRVSSNSGVVLTEAPFNLDVKDNLVLCELPHLGGILRTNLYRLA